MEDAYGGISGKTLGFIGAGNMAEAMVGALISSGRVKPEAMMASDRNADALKHMADAYGIRTTPDNMAVFVACDVVVLAVKPQIIPAVVTALASGAGFSEKDRRTLVISIAAGIPLDAYASVLYAPLSAEAEVRMPIVRVMPNTPSLVCAGMAGMCGNCHAQEDDLVLAETLLSAMGKVIRVPEELLDAVTALSGSGPAYVFLFAEAMTAAGIAEGLDRETARLLTIQTIRGAAKMMAERPEAPEALRRNVTSPGGTTEAALKTLTGQGFFEMIQAGVRSAAARSRELSR
ncbi:MAG: pyrroline-5-carboxylate reductase [Deltaproteobacteria bacterium]|nr:MAG: pyrroline-5-carboxylate reductase [Deltaproteobacteria bacterium]